MGDNDDSSSPPSVLVIGIGGCSGSGKSILSLFLSLRFASHVAHVFHQDHYFLVERARPFVSTRGLQFNNIEHPNAIDFERLERDVRERRDAEIRQLQETAGSGDSSTAATAVRWPRLILVEGFLLFSSPSAQPLHSLFSLSLFMHAGYMACYQRRFERSKIVGSSSYNQEQYHSFFRELVWAAYCKYNAHVLDLASPDVQQAAVDVHSPLAPNTAPEEHQLPSFLPPTAPIRHLHMLSSEDEPQTTFDVAAQLISDLHPALAEHAARCEAIAQAAAAADPAPDHCAADDAYAAAASSDAANRGPASPTAHCRFLTRAERLVVVQRVQCALLSQHLLIQGASDAEVRRVLLRTSDLPKEAEAAAAAIAVNRPPSSQAARSFDLFSPTPNSADDASTTGGAATAAIPSPAAAIAAAAEGEARPAPAPPAPSPLLLAPVSAASPLSPSHVLAYNGVPLSDLSDMRLLTLLCINARRKK